MRKLMVSLAGLSLALTGCDQLLEGVNVVAVLTKTPRLDGADALTTNPELVAALSGLVSSEQLAEAQDTTGIFVGFGKKENLTAPLEPLTGATISLSWNGGLSQIGLCERPDLAAGAYGAVSAVLDDPCWSKPGLAYAPESDYRLDVDDGSDNYFFTFKAPSPLQHEAVVFTPSDTTVQLYGAVNVKAHEAGQGLSVDWSADSYASSRNTFVTVWRIDFAGNPTLLDDVKNPANWSLPADVANPVFDNLPKDPNALAMMLFQNPATSVDIPGDLFAQQGLYFVAIIPTELSAADRCDDGSCRSDNLSTASGGLAGVASLFPIYVYESNPN